MFASTSKLDIARRIMSLGESAVMRLKTAFNRVEVSSGEYE